MTLFMKQVFAYESEDDSDAEDNIIKPTDNVLLTASTDEVKGPGCALPRATHALMQS